MSPRLAPAIPTSPHYHGGTAARPRWWWSGRRRRAEIIRQLVALALERGAELTIVDKHDQLRIEVKP